VDTIQVRVTATPRLLADLILRAIDRPPLQRWTPGGDTPIVTIADVDDAESGLDSRVLVGLARDLDAPITVALDGHRELIAQVAPDGLHQLVLELVQRCEADPVRH
jgi:hypothetical protein